MKTIKVTIRNGKVGCECTEELEVEDDASDSEIDELAREVVDEVITWDWKDITEKSDGDE